MDRDLITADEAAELVKIPAGALVRMAENGAIPFTWQKRKGFQFRAADLRAVFQIPPPTRPFMATVRKTGTQKPLRTRLEFV